VIHWQSLERKRITCTLAGTSDEANDNDINNDTKQAITDNTENVQDFLSQQWHIHRVKMARKLNQRIETQTVDDNTVL